MPDDCPKLYVVEIGVNYRQTDRKYRKNKAYETTRSCAEPKNDALNHKTPPTDYGRPMKPFFHWNPKLLELGRQIGQINFGAFGIFSAELSVPILVHWVPCPQISPCPCFLLFNHYFYKKLSLYIHISNIYLGLGFEFEFGPGSP